jgi:hypothetical protein
MKSDPFCTCGLRQDVEVLHWSKALEDNEQLALQQADTEGFSRDAQTASVTCVKVMLRAGSVMWSFSMPKEMPWSLAAVSSQAA